MGEEPRIELAARIHVDRPREHDLPQLRSVDPFDRIGHRGPVAVGVGTGVSWSSVNGSCGAAPLPARTAVDLLPDRPGGSRPTATSDRPHLVARHVAERSARGAGGLGRTRSLPSRSARRRGGDAPLRARDRRRASTRGGRRRRTSSSGTRRRGDADATTAEQHADGVRTRPGGRRHHPAARPGPRALGRTCRSRVATRSSVIPPESGSRLASGKPAARSFPRSS